MKEINMLVLDDEVSILSALNRLFHDASFSIYTTTNYLEALDVIAKNKVKVVLSDYRMSDITGIEFLRKVKDLSPQIIRIIFTGYADVQVAQDAINKGEVYRFIDKPWDDDSLKVTIKDAMRQFDIIEDNKNLLVTVQKQNEDLKSLDLLKSEFISNVSHELRTPITAMLAVLDNINMGVAGDMSQVPEKLSQYIVIMEKNARNLKEIVDDLLDVFKLTTDNFILEFEDAVDFSKLVQEELDNIKLLAEEKKINILYSPVSLNPIKANSRRIKQVIRNLIFNAVKFTDNQGTIEVIVTLEDTNLVCKVKDFGIGIEQKDLEVIFDRFVQIEQKAKGKPKGTGLGLAICRKIVELHGGKIWAQSQVGQGATFIFTLPTK